MSDQPALPRYAGETLGCFGKQAFKSAADALKALANAPKRRGKGRKLVQYRCPYCRAFHIGGQAK